MLEDNRDSFDKLEQEIETRRLREHFYEKDYYNSKEESMTDFLNSRRALTLRQTQEIGFPYWEYPSLHENIFSLGRLDFKEWGHHMTITTFFTLESGYFGQAKFSTFRGKNDFYMPTKGHVNLAEAEVGEYFVLKLKSKVGGSSFIEEIWAVDYDENLAEAVQKIFQEVADRKKK
ncbi:hypothetical protein LLUC08_1141 [Lactococcus lactis subsp. lactis]|jgi:hypothetical protein|uniref:Uncharacterized protein n=1 Tax=Lactococcus lactis subsp. lactis TaxID=1360 RepID=A0AAC9W8M6_LACLL|nr:hypothetical protein [Lactococcus lactis]ARE13473.1 hypothetical protein LLUC11_1140 [Lactococcus lactis subsp. lactis]ARE15883.1 hypothetical protein LLUC08_1141 [Lactococcus lactis subsp. lactis]